MKKDVFIVDKYLLKFGVFFLVVGLATTLFDTDLYFDLNVDVGHANTIPINYNGKTLEEIQQEYGSDVIITPTEKPFIRPIIAINGLLLLFSGFYYRKKENKIHIIWDALEKTKGGAKLGDLEASLGLSMSFILDNIGHINAQLGAYYVHLPDKDQIVDGRLVEEHTLSLTCSGCGNSINQKVSLDDLEKPICNFCGAAIPVAELSKLRSKILNYSAAVDESSTKEEFDIGTFIALLILLPPLGIGYIVYKKNLAFLAKKENMTKLIGDLRRMKG